MRASHDAQASIAGTHGLPYLTVAELPPVAAAGVADSMIHALGPIAHALQATLGSHCEVVVHDFRQGDGSIVDIAGDVTGRHVGGSMSEIGLALIAQGTHASDRINYMTTTPAGKVIRSSTVLLREADKEPPFGAFCLNIDVTALQAAANTLLDLSSAPNPPSSNPPASTTVFSDSPEQVIDDILQRFLISAASTRASGPRERRRAAVAALDKAGAFQFKRAVPYIAACLDVSRATLYTDLAEVRRQDPSWERQL